MSSKDQEYLQLAIEQAKKGGSEGGEPIGAVLVSKDGKILGRGYNKKFQKNSVILHGETDALEDAGPLSAEVYAGSTMYTTMSPCDMCSGACLKYGIKRVVLGENKTFKGPEEYLKERGVEVINLESDECVDLIKTYYKEHPNAVL